MDTLDTLTLADLSNIRDAVKSKVDTLGDAAHQYAVHGAQPLAEHYKAAADKYRDTLGAVNDLLNEAFGVAARLHILTSDTTLAEVSAASRADDLAAATARRAAQNGPALTH